MAEFDTMDVIRRKKKSPWFRYKHVWIGILIGVMLLLAIAAGVYFLSDTPSDNPTDTTSDPCQITLYAQVNGIKMENNGTYTVSPGDVVIVEASSSEATIEMIGYYWKSSKDKEIIDEYSNRLSIVMPEKELGFTDVLYVEAVAANDNGSANKRTKTGWIKYHLVFAEGTGANGKSVYDKQTGDKLGEYTDTQNQDRFLEGEGRITLTDGTICEGVWKDGKPIGIFTCSFPTGCTYVGTISDIYRPEGSGRFTNAAGETVNLTGISWIVNYPAVGMDTGVEGYYTGMSDNNGANGYGMTSWEDGSFYKGECKNNSMSGYGVYTAANSDVYSGLWEKGALKEGHADYADGAVYDGEFLDFIPHGEGTSVLPDGTICTGGWVKGVLNGQCKVTYPSGMIFEGLMVDGSAEGQGTATEANGNVYVGEFSNGKYNGYGTCTYTDGSVYQGMWVDSERNGQGVFTDVDGTVSSGTWVDDEFTGEDTQP